MNKRDDQNIMHQKKTFWTSSKKLVFSSIYSSISNDFSKGAKNKCHQTKFLESNLVCIPFKPVKIRGHLVQVQSLNFSCYYLPFVLGAPLITLWNEICQRR